MGAPLRKSFRQHPIRPEVNDSAKERAKGNEEAVTTKIGGTSQPTYGDTHCEQAQG
jgi:hypothetical protein